MWEIIKIISQALFILIAAYVAFRYGLKKERQINQEKEEKRLKGNKDFLIHSIGLLIPSTKNQSNNLKNYVERLAQEENVVRNVESDHEFHLRNIDSINPYDVFKIFISDTKINQENRLSLITKFNQSIYLIRYITDDFDKSNLQFHIGEDEYLREMTNIMSNIWRTYNEIVESNKGKKLSNPLQIHFVYEVKKLNTELEDKDLGNVFVSKREFIDKLKPLTDQYKIRKIWDLTSDYLIAFQNFITLRKDFIEKFTKFSEYLESVHNNLSEIESEFND